MISARNTLQSKVVRVVQGAVNAEVTLELTPGVEVAVITLASVDTLRLAEGSTAYAVRRAA